MDLKELTSVDGRRHPWETTRLKVLRQILAPYLFEGIRILDIGCGDSFISTNLFGHLKSKKLTAVDINLSDQQIQELGERSPWVEYRKDLPAAGHYDLVLILDVLEHVEPDRAFLSDLMEKYAGPDGKALITVPAFQCIFTAHDTFLGHYRRYSLRKLVRLATECNLGVLRSGYLFSSLLLPKLILYKLTREPMDGVGKWKGGGLVTGLVEFFLGIDNNLLLLLARCGIKLPGLTGWALCRKRG